MVCGPLVDWLSYLNGGLNGLQIALLAIILRGLGRRFMRGDEVPPTPPPP